MHDLLPQACCPVFFNVHPYERFEDVEMKLALHKINYPLIVKPEVGGKGILFRKIDSALQLLNYHTKIPVEYFIQELITYPMEVSLFYYRHPKNNKGTISGFLHKIPLHVLGDGISTLDELILSNENAIVRLNELRKIHADKLRLVIPKNEKFMLSYAANHSRGAVFVDLQNEIDEKLTSVFDTISHQNEFYYGRYDIMCQSIEDLKKGSNFKILEYNGCGAAANHYYVEGASIVRAWTVILKHWKMLYLISKEKQKQGVTPWPFLVGWRFVIDTIKYYEIIKSADKIIPQKFYILPVLKPVE